MGSYSAEHKSVLILDFSLNDAVAEGAAAVLAFALVRLQWMPCTDRSVRATLVGCGRNSWAQVLRRIKPRTCHRQRAENFALAVGVERFFGQTLQRCAK